MMSTSSSTVISWSTNVQYLLAAVLKGAAAAVFSLPRDRLLWQVTAVQGLSGKCTALVFVHRDLGDGIGGLAALGLLFDGARTLPPVRFPLPPPSLLQFFADTSRSRVRARSWWPAGCRLRRDDSDELRGSHINSPIPPSLNQLTGDHRQRDRQ